MDNYNNYVSVAKAVGTNPVSLVSTNTKRTALVLFNQGEESCKVYMDVTSAYIELLPKQGMSWKTTPINEVFGVTDSGSTTITIMEA